MFQKLGILPKFDIFLAQKFLQIENFENPIGKSLDTTMDFLCYWASYWTSQHLPIPRNIPKRDFEQITFFWKLADFIQITI